MANIKDIFNESTNSNALVDSSLYFQSGSKLVRFADHKCKASNIQANNDNVSDILLVFVNSEISEAEMSDNAEEIADELNCNVEYIYHNDNEDESTLFVVAIVKRFLN